MQWISIDDKNKNPVVGKTYLVSGPHGVLEIALYKKDKDNYCYFDFCDCCSAIQMPYITYWLEMPLNYPNIEHT